MLDSLVKQNIIIREWLNGAMFPLSMCLTVIVALFLADCFREAGFMVSTWRKMPGVQTGCALWWIFLAETIRSGVVWVTLRYTALGKTVPIEVTFWSNLAVMLAVVIFIPAMLRSIYIFTPPVKGHAIWVVSAFMTALFLAITHCLL